MVNIPNEWRPRAYQLPLWSALERGLDRKENGYRRAVALWHRRAGKDSLALNFTAFAAHKRIGVYWHLLPTANQGRKVVWDGIDREGRRMIDQAFPPEIRAGNPNNTDMKIPLACGSLWQVVGSDNYDSLIGANPVGVVLSEWAVADPEAWNFLRPILAENEGWALFIYTSRGWNHGADLYQMAQKNPRWFCQKLTVEDTDILERIPDLLDEERESGMPEEMIQQEYYCSFDAPLVGSYYGDLMKKAEAEGRIGNVPIDPSLSVDTWWDLGVDDATAIWFVQRFRKEIRVIDYLEDSGFGLDYYVKQLREKPYPYGNHYLPHDAKVRELGTGVSRIETLLSLGLRANVVPKLSVADGIQAVRTTIPQCWFDRDRCERGISALRQYQREWNEKLKTFRASPLHDWTSHGADAFRTGAVGTPKSTDWGEIEYDNRGIV